MNQQPPLSSWQPQKKRHASGASETLDSFLYPSTGADNLFVNRINPSTQAPSRLTQYATNSKEFHLEMLTRPSLCIATEWTDDKKPRAHKKRKATEWPLEPAPVLAFKTSNGIETTDHGVLTSCPNVFCIATLTDREGMPVSPEIMRGRHSSSLFKLEKDKSPKLDTKSPTMGVFLFDQIHIRYPGEYCLLFTLFEMQMHDQGMHAVVHNVVRSESFTVLPQPKRLPKPEPPAEILLALAAQGAKIKIRKPNEDRVKRKTDWSLNANNPDWPAQAQMMQQQQMPIPVPGQMMQPIPMSQPGFLPTTMSMSMSSMSLPMPLQMPITTAPYQMTMQAPAPMAYQQQQQPTWGMQPAMGHEIPQDMNFGGFQDPTQQYMFQGSHPPQHGFGNDYNNGNYQ